MVESVGRSGAQQRPERAREGRPTGRSNRSRMVDGISPARQAVPGFASAFLTNIELRAPSRTPCRHLVDPTLRLLCQPAARPHRGPHLWARMATWLRQIAALALVARRNRPPRL